MSMPRVVIGAMSSRVRRCLRSAGGSAFVPGASQPSQSMASASTSHKQ